MVSRRNRKIPKHKNVNSTLNLLASAPPPLRLQLPPFQNVRLTLAGCGGTGSHLVSGLGALACELRTRGTACDLQFIDFDIVELKNVGRQLFTAGDVGKAKCVVLAERLMRAYGIATDPILAQLDPSQLAPVPNALNLVIGAVDNSAARGVIAQAVDLYKGNLWWLNCGNELASGQVALGNIGKAKQMRGAVELGMLNKLPAPHVLYPDCIAAPRVKRSKRAASCAELTARGEQGLMVNRMVAAWTLELLHAFLIARDLKWFALAFDLAWGNARAFALDLPTLAAATGLRAEELG